MAQSGNFQSIGFFVNVLLLDCSKFSTITAFSIVHQVINGYHSLDNVKSIFPIRNGQSLILGRECGFYFNRFKQTAVISWFNAINCGEMKIFNKYLTILIVSLQDFFLLQLFLGFLFSSNSHTKLILTHKKHKSSVQFNIKFRMMWLQSGLNRFFL